MTRTHAKITAGPVSVAAGITLLLCRVSAGGVDPARAYEQLYGAKEKQALASATKADDVALARELLADAAKLADSPKLRDMLYEKAYAMAVTHRDGYATAEQAMQRLAEADPARKPDARKKLQALYALMARNGTAEQRSRANAAIRAEIERKKVEKRFTALREKLKGDPADASAARALVLLCVVELDDPNRALPYAGATQDEWLRTNVPVAARPLDKLTDADACRGLGDWCRKLAGQASADGAARKMLLHARACYERCLALHGGAQNAAALMATKLLAKVKQGIEQLDRDAGPPAWLPKDKRLRFYKCVLSIYKLGTTRTYYPYVNLADPNANLWSEAAQNALRGKVPFEEIAYEGSASLYVPADGIYVVECKDFQARIDGKAIGGPGEITLKKGRHDVHLAVGTHGGPYIRGATFRVVSKETKADVPLVNSLAAIERFLARRLKGHKLTEVSGWDAARTRPVRVPYK